VHGFALIIIVRTTNAFAIFYEKKIPELKSMLTSIWDAKQKKPHNIIPI